MKYIRYVVTLKPEYEEKRGKLPYPYEVVLKYKNDEKLPKRRHWEFQCFCIDAYESNYKEKWKIKRRHISDSYQKIIRYVGCKMNDKEKEFFKFFTDEQLRTDPFAKRKDSKGIKIITDLDAELPL